MTVMRLRLASATATAVLPTPVGPTITGVRCWVLGAAEPALKLFLGKLDHRRSPMNVMRRQRRAQQPHHQLAHFVHVERLSGLDRRATGVRSGKPLEPVLPPAKPAAGQIR